MLPIYVNKVWIEGNILDMTKIKLLWVLLPDIYNFWNR